MPEISRWYVLPEAHVRHFAFQLEVKQLKVIVNTDDLFFSCLRSCGRILRRRWSSYHFVSSHDIKQTAANWITMLANGLLNISYLQTAHDPDAICVIYFDDTIFYTKRIQTY